MNDLPYFLLLLNILLARCCSCVLVDMQVLPSEDDGVIGDLA